VGGPPPLPIEPRGPRCFVIQFEVGSSPFVCVLAQRGLRRIMRALRERRTIDAPPCPSWRWRSLGRPWFFGLVIILALNDHLLKPRFPGWWTGKLSDVAGVAIVATVAAVLVGRGRGLALAGIGFVILKTVPGAAEVAGPFLGGVTSRDPSDLLALVILIPFAHLLAPCDGITRVEVVTSPSSGGPHDVWRRSRAGLSTAIPIAGAFAALVVTTATSCSPGPAVTRVIAGGGILYANVDQGWDEPQWARSRDGGNSWEPSEAPPGSPPTSQTDRDPSDEPSPAGPTEICASDGTCWRLRDQRVIERRSPGTDWIEEFRLSDDEFSAISTGCANGQVGILASIAATDGPDGPQVVASLGANGVLTRQGNGTWQQNRVLAAPPIEASRVEHVASGLFVFFGPVLAVAFWLVGRHRWPSVRSGLIVIGVGWLCSIFVSGLAAFWNEGSIDPARVIWPVEVVGMVVTTVVAIAVARRTPHKSSPSEPGLLPPRPDIG